MQQQFQEPESTSSASVPLVSSVTEAAMEGVQATVTCNEGESKTGQTLLPSTVSGSSLFQQACREASKWRHVRHTTLCLSAALFFVSFVFMSTIRLPPPQASFFATGFLMLIASLFGLLAGVLMRPRRANPIHHLWQTDDVQAVGPLLEATQLLLPEVKNRAIDALIRLLPHVQAGDAALLNAYQRVTLRQLLRAGPIEQPDYEALALEGIPASQIEATRQHYQNRSLRQRALALGILKALEQIGGDQDRAIVETLAEEKGMARNEEEIRDAARHCLLALNARSSQEHISRTYLRAAGEPVSPGETLLRPAEAGAESDPRQLLRAAEPENPVQGQEHPVQ